MSATFSHKKTGAPQARWIEAGGVHFHAELAGRGDAVTMLHGFLVDSGQWDEEFDALAADHRVLRYDLRGFGRSSMPDTPFAHHEDLARVLDDSGIERTALIGCSGGAGSALDFALQQPERVSALAFIGAGYWGHYATRTPQAQAFWAAVQSGDSDALLETSLRSFVDGPRRSQEQSHPQARARIAAMSAWNFGRADGYWKHATLQRNPAIPAPERLAELRMPVLLIVGEEDQPEVIELSECLAAGLPHARLVRVADAGHHVNIERPDVVLPLLRDFLAEVRA
ncbi:alpha/beta fold hydrolase [Dyella sp. 2RAB6]|uniref:alpha/beta fold hydrolase n=1 Tax=Dyella sp. 2RAB6 TaxID=3232992 RepID=UPI003F8FB540